MGFARDEVAWSPSNGETELGSQKWFPGSSKVLYTSLGYGNFTQAEQSARFRIMHPVRGPVPGKWCRTPQMEDECGTSPMITNHTKPGRVLDHTPAAMLRRMGDGSARALKKVVSSCDMRRVGARSL